MASLANEMDKVVSELNDQYVDNNLVKLLKHTCNVYGPTSIGSRKFSIACLIAQCMADQATSSEELMDIMGETLVYLETMTIALHLSKHTKQRH